MPDLRWFWLTSHSGQEDSDMGSAYFIVLNSNDAGFDATVDGKALARHSSVVDGFAKELGFKSLDEYCSQSHEDAQEMMASLMGFDEVEDLPPEVAEALANLPAEEWYDAEHGIEYAEKVGKAIREKASSVMDADAVLYDLDSMGAVLTQAKEHGLKWHFQVGF